MSDMNPLAFSVPTAGVDTALPVLAPGEYPFQIAESVVKPNHDQNGFNWNLKFGLESSATSTDGRNISPNFPVFKACPLQAKEDSKDPMWFRRNLGEVQDGIFATTKDNRPDLSPEIVSAALGKRVLITLSIGSGQNGQPQNEIKKIRPNPNS